LTVRVNAALPAVPLDGERDAIEGTGLPTGGGGASEWPPPPEQAQRAAAARLATAPATPLRNPANRG
jgi:hypothetical protein